MNGTQPSTVHGRELAYPADGRIDRLVGRWAARTPDAVALRHRGAAMTYRELLARATEIAAALRERGVQRGDRVAVRLDRSFEQVAVLLGVLLADAVYAAVAPDWPIARCTEVLAQTGAVLGVSTEDLPGVPTHRPDDLHSSVSLMTGRAAPTDPCCVFFTSGSSGTPRAALITHGGMARVALDPDTVYPSGPSMLQISPAGWDAMALELWCPLVNGGSVTLFDGRHPSSVDVRQAVKEGVDTLFLTTTLFNALLDDDIDCLSGVRQIITGGERLSATHAATLLKHHPGVRLQNAYGPVEGSLYVTSCHMTEPAEALAASIGRPVPNTTLHLLDDRHRVVPAGQKGEIAIGGDAVALGYLGDPATTAARFVQLPLGPADELVRVYLTGDFATLDRNGQLEFAGRKDRQFKLRGARVEPEEVERVAEQLPEVGQALLLALPLGPVNKKESVLFLTPGCGLPAGEVRAHLAARFPAAFVPRRVLPLAALPTNANGKADLPALAALVDALPGSGQQEFDWTDADPLTKTVALIAAELIGEAVGPDTDLFAAGASSITAIQLISRLFAETGRRLSAADVLAARTPRRLAATPVAAPATTAQTGRRDRWIHGLPATQYRMWYLEQQFPGAGDFTNVLLFQIRGEVDANALRGAVAAVVDRHEALRTLLHKTSPSTVDIEVRPAGDPLVIVPADPTAGLRAPFDLGAELPIRFRYAPETGLLAIAVHHTAYDGWSEAVLCADLSVAYRAIRAGRAPQWPPVLGFHPVARLQDHGDQEESARFWTDHLRDVPDLPLGGPPPQTPTAPIGTVPVELTGDDLAAVRRRSTELGVTPTALLLTAWVRTLRAATGATDFALGMPMAGRSVPEADGVVGCFASSAVLRFRAVADPVAEVRSAAGLLATALAEQFVPIERLLYQLQPPQSGRNPFCQAGFVLQNNEPAVLELDGAEVVRLPDAVPDAAFELALQVWPEAPFRGHLWYRQDVLDADRAARLAEAWPAEVRALL